MAANWRPVLWADIEVERAKADERDCDYLITDEREGVDLWEAWELADEEHVLVVEGRAPDDLSDAVEDETIFDVVWPHEVKRGKVVEETIEVEERRTFFAEEPPMNLAEPVGHRESVELLKRRGMDTTMGAMEGAWYFPVRNDAGFHFVRTDEEEEAYDTYRTVKNLSDEEVRLLRGDLDAYSDGDELEFRELADRIHEQSALYERQSQYVAAIVRDDETFEKIRDRVNSEFGDDLTYNDVTKSWYAMMDRQEEIAWQVMHVWPHLPKRYVTEEMERIIDALDVEASPEEPEWWVTEE